MNDQDHTAPTAQRSPRFAYTKFDGGQQDALEQARQAAENLEDTITSRTLPGRAQATALTKPEECFMWIGKAIRDSAN